MSTLQHLTQLTRINELSELVREDQAVLREIGRGSTPPGRRVVSSRPADTGRADYLLLVLGLLLVAIGAVLAVLGSFPG